MDRYIIRELSNGLLSIEDGIVRAFLISGSERAMLVDTGFGTGDIKKVVGNLTDLPVLLVNTHTDGDHIGCNASFEGAYMHPAEFDRYCSKGTPPCAPLPLWEGDVIDLGGFRFEVILIPGHTPGSIALLERNKRFLIAGDSVQSGDIYMFGPGRNLPAYIASMKKLLALSDAFDTVYASHAEAEVKPGIIPGLIDGATALLDGKLEGREPPQEWMKGKCLLYRFGVAGMLY